MINVNTVSIVIKITVCLMNCYCIQEQAEDDQCGREEENDKYINKEANHVIK